MKKILTVFLSLIFIINSYSIIPPKKGVTPPANFLQLKRNIEKSYNTGYYAKKMETRKLLREKIQNGSLAKATLVNDTVFALTLLGRYTNSTPIYSPAAFQQKLFDGPNSTGTLKDFYKECSYGQMYMSGECLGWFNLPKTMETYVGTNNGLDQYGGPTFVHDMLLTADSTINFADYIQYYDASGNPRIGFIAAVHTGGDAAAGANNIWSHRWSFSYFFGEFVTNDTDPKSGKKVIIDGDYAIEPELNGKSNTSGGLVDIGVFAHEFGHIFSLPDLYDTDYSSEGLGNWCLMAAGSYGGNGSAEYSPTFMSAWCKVKLGWVTPIDITSLKENVSIPNVEENPIVYRMWKKDQPIGKEYFLVENRQLLSFDRFNYQPGILIYHVDESMEGYDNTADDHYLVDLEQADGLRNLNHGQNRGDNGDPFPGATLNHTFDPASSPNSSTYSNGDSYVSVRNMRLEDLTAIADFDLGTKPYLIVKSADFKETSYQNGRVEPGETGSVALNIVNIEPAPSDSVTVNFSIEDPGVQILKNQQSLSVAGLENKTVTVDSVFRLANNFIPKMLWLKYSVTSEGNSFSDSVKIIAGIPKVLIVSKAENKSFNDYYTKSLESSDIEPEEVFNDLPKYVSNRSVVIYLSGTNKDSLITSSEIDTLTNFTNNGGRLILSGQNFAEYLNVKYPTFLTNQVGVNWVKNGSPFYKNIYGKAGDPLGDKISFMYLMGTDGARNEKTPDVITANSGFNVSFGYKKDISEVAGGWKSTANNGKIVFLGFGFESISNAESSNSRTEIMRTLMNELGVAVDVKDNNVAPLSYSLSQNYPNPFNPSTIINYSLPKASHVRLEVFDITGSRIAVLVNKEQQQGTYDITVNMQELNLSSGVYFYKLTAGDFYSVKKMMLIK